MNSSALVDFQARAKLHTIKIKIKNQRLNSLISKVSKKVKLFTKVLKQVKLPSIDIDWTLSERAARWKLFPIWPWKKICYDMSTSTRYKIFGKFIIVTDSRIHFCEESALEIFSLTREGFSLSNLVSKFVSLFLNYCLTPEIRSLPKIGKTFILDDHQGRLKFTWQKYIITKSLNDSNVSESDHSGRSFFIEQQISNWF